MSIEGQGHFFTIYFPGFVCFVLYFAKISGERLQDHWSSGFICVNGFRFLFLYINCFCFLRYAGAVCTRYRKHPKFSDR